MLILRAAMSLIGIALSYIQDMGDFQRALVFQGGGALGAYESDVYYKSVLFTI
jgi:hypothetical protein